MMRQAGPNKLLLQKRTARLPILGCFLVVIFLASARAPGETGDATPSDKDCVILLHGLARTAASMDKMAAALTAEGYQVVNDTYPSREHTIEVLAPLAIDAGLEKCGELSEQRKVHFVTHSLGGILVRYYFEYHNLAQLGRVVMLAPPNQGSEASDDLRDVPGFDLLNGPAGSQLGKGDDSVPLQLGTPDFEFAVIAGDRSIDPVTSAVLPNPDDGKVSVADTRLDGMSDFALVHVSHAYIMKDKTVIEMVKRFLRTGQLRQGQP
jgi:pimeloyl-ACP methyl ester carboxylesterase